MGPEPEGWPHHHFCFGVYGFLLCKMKELDLGGLRPLLVLTVAFFFLPDLTGENCATQSLMV